MGWPLAKKPGAAVEGKEWNQFPEATHAPTQHAGQCVTAAPFKFDEIGYWSELKLEIVEKYGSAYTNAFANQKGLKSIYIDAFAGAGIHVSKRTGEQIEGSPARALKVSPPFDHFYFIDMDADKTNYLASLCKDRTDVTIHTGDATQHTSRETTTDHKV